MMERRTTTGMGARNMGTMGAAILLLFSLDPYAGYAQGLSAALSDFGRLDERLSSQDAAGQDVEVSGFGDFWYVGADEKFETAQAEADLGTALDQGTGLSAALASDGESFGLGASAVNFPFWVRQEWS
jgi:hypothetical protein